MTGMVPVRRLRAAIFISVFLMLPIAPVPAKAAEQGFLGMQVQGMSPTIAAALGLKEGIGVLIRDITIDGPASNAGLIRGDLIVSMHGTAIDTFERMVQVAQSLSAGDTVSIEIVRLGARKVVKMVLAPWPDGWKVDQSAFAVQPDIGITFASLTPKMRNRLGIRWSSTGIVVSVTDETFASVTSLRRGDIVAQINQRRVWMPQQFIDIYAEAKAAGRKNILMLVERADGFKYIIQPIAEADRNAVQPPVFNIPSRQGG